jgi:hypothetical protein
MEARDLATRLKLCGAFFLSIAAIWAFARIAMILTSQALRTTDETVTLDSSRHAAAMLLPPVISKKPLPASDSDLEVTGDHIAEAVVYSNQGQRDAALRALDLAQTVAWRALARSAIKDKVREKLKLILREMDQARLNINRGRYGAASLALRKLDQQLDAGAF